MMNLYKITIQHDLRGTTSGEEMKEYGKLPINSYFHADAKHLTDLGYEVIYLKNPTTALGTNSCIEFIKVGGFWLPWDEA